MTREDSRTSAGMPKRRSLTWIVALLVVAAVAFAGWQAVCIPRGTAVLEALSSLLKELPMDEQRIGKIILDNYTEYRGNARNWSAVHFGCLFFSAVCAAVAGLVIKLEFLLKNDGLKKDLGAILAMLAALLITLSTVGGFHQRWWANRLAAAKIEKVAYAFIMTSDRKANLEAFSSQIQTISYERNEEIVSSDGDRNKTNGNKKDTQKAP